MHTRSLERILYAAYSVRGKKPNNNNNAHNLLLSSQATGDIVD